MDGRGTGDGTMAECPIFPSYDLHGSRLEAEEAFAAREVPVGCVFVRDGKIVAQARNRTNELRNVSENVQVGTATNSSRCRQLVMLN